MIRQALGIALIRDRYPLQLYGNFASATHSDRRTPPRHPRTPVIWSVDTGERLVALTFDDGPMPRWTPEVLTILEEQAVRATFFLVGRNVQAHGGMLAGRHQHEFANHTWQHLDLATMDYAAAHDALRRAHVTIARVTGREPTLFRPPFGHLAGSSLLAAADMGYTTVLWNLQMLESDYRDEPQGLVDYIVNTTSPGSIVLAHDTGAEDRLVAIRGLADMIRRLKRRGYAFVTVGELVAAGTACAATGLPAPDSK
ncbi:MAG TPA: polysaccharide deacetylase family protein [Candidatus Limnocylindrales bacterium]